jgi:hypothetical protein
MVRPSDGETWKVPDSFDADFVIDVRNVRFRLMTDDFDPFSTNFTPYSSFLVFVVLYNPPPSLCMKYEFMFL